MPSTTEIATLNLVAGSDIGDPDNHAAQVLKESCDTISKQDGCQQIQFGMQVENPDLLQLFVNWDTKADHETFQASDVYTPFVNRFSTIFAADPHLIHVDLKPDGGLASSLSAPVTEIATFYFDGAPPEDAFENAEKFINLVGKESGEKVLGWSYGITHEEIEKDGVKGKGAVLTVGWESVDAHMRVRGTEVFKEKIGLLRLDSKGIEMHHTRVLDFVAT